MHKITQEENRPLQSAVGTTVAVAVACCSLLVSLVLAVILFTTSDGGGKVAFVQSGKIVYGYMGMKESHELYKQHTESWQANIDTLRSDFQKAMNAYQMEYTKLSAQERAKREELLQRQEENLVQYAEAIGSKAREEESKMTQSVLNQVNSFAKEYGEEHGYRIIFGTTSDGSILYGEDALDITDELLAALNHSYRNGEVADADSSQTH